MPPTTLRYAVTDHVATVTFAAPARLNAIDDARMDDLDWVLDELERDQEIAAAVFTGEGRAFCVGLDLAILKRGFEDTDYFLAVIRRLNDILLRLERLPLLTVAAVNGVARAGGFETALACDLILVAEEARIGDNHAQVNVMPGGGSTQRLPRRIGMAAAKELIMSGRWLSGREAATIGLAWRAVPLAELPVAVDDLLKKIRGRSRACLRAIKAAMDGGGELPIEQGIALEIATFERYLREHDDARRGFWDSLGRDG
ncbi:MAG: enoyl-CoA hydratase/isomerase family protein [Alphaproteobacteria bacterium]